MARRYRHLSGVSDGAIDLDEAYEASHVDHVHIMPFESMAPMVPLSDGLRDVPLNARSCDDRPVGAKR